MGAGSLVTFPFVNHVIQSFAGALFKLNYEIQAGITASPPQTVGLGMRPAFSTISAIMSSQPTAIM